MYKVFVNYKKLVIAEKASYDKLPLQERKGKACFSGMASVHDAIRHCRVNTDYEEVYLVAANEKKLWQAFRDQFEIVEAAGGIVQNGKKELLMIFRKGKWDLPKGKVDSGETNQEAAVREVCEETGVCDLRIRSGATVMYHTYRTDHRQILKKTYWYEMECLRFTRFRLERKEQIQMAGWFPLERAIKLSGQAYPSIAALIGKKFKMR